MILFSMVRYLASISLLDIDRFRLEGFQTDAQAVQDAEMTAKRGKPTLSRKYLQLTVSSLARSQYLYLVLLSSCFTWKLKPRFVPMAAKECTGRDLNC